jgi:2'-hydroxyisoflavone reductase
MDILLMGGTRFVGRHLVSELVSRGHQVTLFNRGTNQVFPNLQTIVGDRNQPGDRQKLPRRPFDAIVDTCAYFPRQVRDLQAIFPDIPQYVLISSISVYREQQTPGLDEDSDLITISPETPEHITGETYGGFKVLCENAARCWCASSLLIRPGFIVGPYDSTDRFTFWPYRIAHYEKLLVPDCPESPLQFIDARDLARFAADAIAAGRTGEFNLVNTPGEWCFRDLIETSFRVTASKADQIRVPEEFLRQRGIKPWSDLPFWTPGREHNFLLASNRKALLAGLVTRSLEQTIRETCEWFLAENKISLKAGLSKAQEESLILEWEQATR